MGTTTSDNLDTKFNVQSGFIRGELDGLLDSSLEKGEVLIFSDVNHGNSQTMDQDMLSSQKLQQYSAHGVTDIYLERLEDIQPAIDSLALGQISKTEFAQQVSSISSSRWNTAVEEQAETAALADAVLQGASMVPPIRFHAVQISNTAEQQAALASVDLIEDDTYSGYLSRVNRLSNEISEHTNLDIDDIVFLNSSELGDSFTSSAEPELDYYTLLTEHFGDRVPNDILQNAASDFHDLKENQTGGIGQYNALTAQYRIDNDSILAERIADTRNPDGKAIVIHGAGHGAYRDGIIGRDLDEILSHEYGLNNVRVNVVYDKFDLLRNAENIDNSEISYFPERDEVVASDFNGNGQIDGTQGYTFGRFPGA